MLYAIYIQLPVDWNLSTHPIAELIQSRLSDVKLASPLTLSIIRDTLIYFLIIILPQRMS